MVYIPSVLFSKNFALFSSYSRMFSPSFWRSGTSCFFLLSFGGFSSDLMLVLSFFLWFSMGVLSVVLSASVSELGFLFVELIGLLFSF